MAEQKFGEWLDTFLEEKNIDLETTIEINDKEWNLMSVEVVVEFMKNLPENDQKIIKDKLVAIDFQNGDVMHFIKFIAKGMTRIY